MPAFVRGPAVPSAGDEQALLPEGTLGLSTDSKPLQPTDSQVLCGESVGATQGKLQVLDQSEFQQLAQCGCIREPDGQVVISGLLHGKRQDRFTAAHQAGQTVVTVSDANRAAAVANGISLCENQGAAVLTFCEVAQCKDA